MLPDAISALGHPTRLSASRLRRAPAMACRRHEEGRSRGRSSTREANALSSVIGRVAEEAFLERAHTPARIDDRTAWQGAFSGYPDELLIRGRLQPGARVTRNRQEVLPLCVEPLKCQSDMKQNRMLPQSESFGRAPSRQFPPAFGCCRAAETLVSSTVIRMPRIFVSNSDTNSRLNRGSIHLAKTRLASLALV